MEFIKSHLLRKSNTLATFPAESKNVVITLVAPYISSGDSLLKLSKTCKAFKVIISDHASWHGFAAAKGIKLTPLAPHTAKDQIILYTHIFLNLFPNTKQLTVKKIKKEPLFETRWRQIQLFVRSNPTLLAAQLKNHAATNSMDYLHVLMDVGASLNPPPALHLRLRSISYVSQSRSFQALLI